MSTQTPILPYGGTSGWSGGPSSRDRALSMDHDGTTLSTQQVVLHHVRQSRAWGLTCKEAVAMTGLGWQRVSSALTTLQKTGQITRLSERRVNANPYILPEHVQGRDTTPYRPNCGKAVAAELETLKAEHEALMDLLRRWLTIPNENGWSEAGRSPKAFVQALRAHTGIS